MKILGRVSGLLFYPNNISFEILSETMAQKNHGQTLSGLNSRGGMSVMEILANLKNDRIVRGIETQNDIDELNDLVKKHKLLSIKSDIINFSLEAVTRHDDLSEIKDNPLFKFENKRLTIDELFNEFFN